MCPQDGISVFDNTMHTRLPAMMLTWTQRAVTASQHRALVSINRPHVLLGMTGVCGPGLEYDPVASPDVHSSASRTLEHVAQPDHLSANRTLVYVSTGS